jgi:hypothetical protein
MTDEIDPAALQRLLRAMRSDLLVTRLALIELASIVLANASRTQREAWLVDFRTLITNAASAMAADPAEPVDARERAEAIEDSANALMDAMETAARSRAGR